MKAAVVLFVAICVACVALTSSESCGRPCPAAVNCVRVSASDCKADEVFIREDGCRHCCDTCVKKSGRWYDKITYVIRSDSVLRCFF